MHPCQIRLLDILVQLQGLVQLFRGSHVCYCMKSLGAACGKSTQEVRSLEENKLMQVQLRHNSGLAGLFESLISGVRYVGNFNSTYSSGLPIMGYDRVPPLATIPKAMTVSIIILKIIIMVWHWTSFPSRSDFPHSG
jgi:hypothetical protein